MNREEDKPKARRRDASAAKKLPADGKLLTSEEIFGDLLDDLAPGAPRPVPSAPEPPPAGRSGPIRVQVSEPAGERKPASGAPLADAPPEDVAALLDAFDTGEKKAAPTASTPDVKVEAAGTPAAEVEDDEVLEVVEMAGEDAGGGAVEDDDDETFEAVWPADTPLGSAPGADPDAELEGLLDALPAKRPTARPWSPEPRAAAAPTTDADERLRPDRVTGRFQAVAPPSAAGQGLDLAALAEQAIEAASPSAPAPTAPPSTATSAPTEAAPADYGPYRLLERIATGGMAEVFRAKRTGVEGFEKVVAVKRILPHLSDNKEFVDMFIDEAKMVAGLSHPNVVQIFDLGKIEQSYYIAMEYVHGRDLRSILRRARERAIRLPLDLAVLVASRVCSALEFAHRKKDERGRPMMIVHRDVSPQNILISFEGEVKLTDFGIAKAATKASESETGALRGKLLYMSPEQAWGRAMDRRSDIFSLGVVFYEMLTDQKPFLGSSEMSILEMVRECRVAPPSTLNSKLPERLERVALTALAKEADDRYQDASEMYRDLERFLHERQPPTSASLARFLELLFDDDERGHTPAEGAGEPAAAAAAGAERASAADQPEAPAAAPAEPDKTDPAPEPSSEPALQRLLKRFGIR